MRTIDLAYERMIKDYLGLSFRDRLMFKPPCFCYRTIDNWGLSGRTKEKLSKINQENQKECSKINEILDKNRAAVKAMLLVFVDKQNKRRK
jgi:hypothetical protein